MCAGTQQAWIIMNNQVNRDVLYVTSETSFIFEPAAETRRFKEVEEARHNAPRDIDATEGAEIQRQVAAETSHDHAEQRQRATAVDAAIGQRAFGNVLRLQVFRQSAVR